MVKIVNEASSRQDDLTRKVRKYLNYRLSTGEDYRKVDSLEVQGDEVHVDYTTSVRVPVGRDPDAGEMQYETEESSETTTIKLSDLEKY